MGGPGRPRAREAQGTRPAPGTRGGARADGARAGGEARPGNEWVGGRGGVAVRRHSLRKTRYSGVKGAARSSLLKPLMVRMTSRSRRHRATSPHAAPTDKEKASRVRTGETGLESGAGNGFKRPTHPARRRTPPGPPGPAPRPAGPAFADSPPGS